MSHHQRMAAARRSLDGLSTGDAFGECFFGISSNPMALELHLSTRTPPNVRWRWTDDTAMAAALVDVLDRHHGIEQDVLAGAFARRYAEDDRRGYGGTAHGILMAIGAGEPWQTVSQAAFDGMGSAGNGAAMRVAALGAYFSSNTGELIQHARQSAEVTHAHPEGQAGAIAVALAAGFAAVHSDLPPAEAAAGMFEHVLRHTPDSQTRALIAQARDLPPTFSVATAASVLGSGFRLTAQDTVPFCLWCAARSFGDFESAVWTTVSAGGDMDTTCAIVGGIVALTEPNGLPPADWVARREPLPQALEL
ncbi:MAG TPA: ADP-ribosylglycohydrolase family protein [Tepidisphaeraceae bacterium]|jgi:ADP-ribosylglycohydrolase